jgi:peptide/nickel transport system substrate-binding protein
MKKLLAVLGAVMMGLLMVPVRAGSPTYVVIEGNPTGRININPLQCGGDVCERLAGFMYPRFLGVDPTTGTFAPDRPDALVKAWDTQDGISYTFTLRDDLQWSDGQPVNAYDALYTLLLILDKNNRADGRADLDGDLTGVRVEGNNRLTLTFAQNACSNLDRANFYVLPAHVYRADFSTLADSILNSADAPQTALKNLQRLKLSLPDGAIGASTVVGGVWRIDQVQPGSFVSFAPVSEEGPSYLYMNMPGGDALAERFISGDLNLIQNPPLDRRNDVRAVPGVQVAEYPGLTWDYIGFNLADPKHPQSAFDKDGKPLEQGHHPLFGDARVRQALQKAINVPELIAATAQGEGTVVPANQLPTSWAFNLDVNAVGYDPAAAKTLLQQAGWFDVNHDGVIECYQCQYARNGTPFTFTLLVDSGNARQSVEANLIQRQLQQLGMVVNLQATNFDDVLRNISSQRYDAYLLNWRESYPINPDQSRLFTTKNDVVGFDFNTSSYSNPDVDRLFEQANTVPGCSVSERADFYRQIQSILQRDQPYLYLYAVNDMVAVRPNVKGFKPYPYAPLWNIDQWQVYSEIN